MKLQSFYRVPLSNCLRLFNLILHKLECINRDSIENPLEFIPIFIIGAPRSGSTLLYQVMTEYYNVGYISNFHCKYTYGAPSLVERIFNPLRWKRSLTFTSVHGRTKGLAAPSECGAYWYRFFRRNPQYVPIEETDPDKLYQLRSSIRAFGNAVKKPILFKNLMCSLRLSPIVSVLPEAVFIVIHRDIVTNAHSLLKGRKDTYNDYLRWWSTEPPDVDNLKLLPAHEQVVEQIRSIYRLIDGERKKLGEQRFFDVRYEEFCADTYGTLDGIEQFLKINNVYVEKRANNNVPVNFKINFSIDIDKDLFQKMVDYINGL